MNKFNDKGEKHGYWEESVDEAFPINNTSEILSKTDKIICKVNYINGKKNGLTMVYLNNILIAKGEFNNDKANGKRSQYYYNGNLQYCGKMLNNQEIGVWLYYNNNGQLKNKHFWL